MENVKGTILVYLLVGWSVGWLQRWADTNVTLAFEDAQIIPSFSDNETDDTDNTYDTDDTYDKDDTDNTDDIDDTEDTDDTDDSFPLLSR